MKKLIFLIMMLSFGIHASSSAQEREKQIWDTQKYKYEVRVGWGMPSDTPASLYNSNPSYSSGGRLSSIYSPKRGSLYSTGGFSAEFGLNFRKWFTLALQTSFTGVWNDVYSYDNSTISRRDRGVVFNLAPQVRFNWVSRPAFRMYSSAGAGFTLASLGKENSVEASFQFVPIGMSAGKDVFFFAELGGGTGSNFLGYHLGLGYRF